MVLTPDQKKRIAALDSGPSQPAEEEPQPSSVASARLKGLGLKITPAQITSILVKILIVLAIIATAAYFIILKDLHKINFKSVFSSGGGGPITKFFEAVKLQNKKAELWEKAQGHLLESEYPEVIQIAKEIRSLDPDDPRSEKLVDDTVIAVTHKAGRKYQSGDIEASLKDVRFAIKYRKEYGPANDLYMEIADRLLLEAQAHAKKKEYEQLIMKSKEVLKINPGNMEAYNLLVETNNELLDRASEYFLSKQYTKALEKVLLASKIDGKNPRTRSLLEGIANKVAAPKLELHGIATMRGKNSAKIKVLGPKSPIWVKEGQIIENYQVVDIDPGVKQVRLRQIHTGEKVTLQQKKKKF